MYKVMIVDDEPIIRHGLKTCINWADDRLEFAGEYSNGAEAFQALEASPADILLTDIKMPLMDGLELTRQAKQKWPGMIVILVSSYNDFDYVRQGMVLGAIDYIQKSTIEPEEIASVIDRSIQLVEKDREIHRSLDQYEQNLQEMKRKRLEQDFKKVLSKGLREEAFNPLLPLCYRNGYAMVISVISGWKEIQEKKGYFYLSMLLDEMQEIFYCLQTEGVSIVTANESEVVLVLPRTGQVREDIHHLKQQLEDKLSLLLTFGYIEDTEPLNWLNNYSKARDVYERRFFDGGGDIYPYSAGASLEGLQETGGHNFIGDCNPEEKDVQVQVIEWIHKWRTEGTGSGQIKKEACELFTKLFKKNVEPLLLLEYCRQFMGSETLQELNHNLVMAIHECDRPQEMDSKHKSANIAIEKAMNFIHEHYTEDITLQMVADHVHISKNYFSLLYKKQTDFNFIDYLIHLRVEKAKDLLRNNTMKIYEVANSSGFNDVKYFSKLFKKVAGVTPVEFREKLRGSDNEEAD